MVAVAVIVAGCVPPGYYDPTPNDPGRPTNPERPPVDVFNPLPCPFVELDASLVNGRQSIRVNTQTIRKLWVNQSSSTGAELMVSYINEYQNYTLSTCNNFNCHQQIETVRNAVRDEIVKTRRACGLDA